MDPATLAVCTGATLPRALAFAPLIDQAMAEFAVDAPSRQAAFLAQIGHESEGLHWLVEIWGPTDAQRRYEGRRDLGNVGQGDGYRYRGRGLIQVTGRANYRQAGQALGLDLEGQPELLAQPELAARSAAWWWKQHGLNELADATSGDAGAFERITRVMNGGTNGLADRIARWDLAKNALGVA
jgi:putative chitinase